jgi:hypothetical protein
MTYLSSLSLLTYYLSLTTYLTNLQNVGNNAYLH